MKRSRLKPQTVPITTLELRIHQMNVLWIKLNKINEKK